MKSAEKELMPAKLKIELVERQNEALLGLLQLMHQ